jgi:uncharacterized Zn finger protein (UPF0148 family)
MKQLTCKNCGADGLVEKNGFLHCEYCMSKFAIESSDVPQGSMGLSLNSDIDRLLKKCKSDPRNARKYANLILDIDPTNKEALKYL